MDRKLGPYFICRILWLRLIPNPKHNLIFIEILTHLRYHTLKLILEFAACAAKFRFESVEYNELMSFWKCGFVFELIGHV